MKKEIEKYTYRIEWSDYDRCHVARCLEFPSLAAHGDTIKEALKEIEYVVAESVKWMEEEGETVPEPLGLKKFKGNLTLRIPPEKHRELAIRCAEEGVSLNSYIISRLST
ncbi:MAG: type II toxin-antitoxin system HicB family antitoxin [Syntrophaceae bacterium]|jgi:predicted HicB family RNase H-like nuclease|nr:type II toxin-antitoxin system HicB family antitoxin [Syntrophaceae bacterium]